MSLAELVEAHSILEISKILGCARQTVYNRMEKLGIPKRGIRPYKKVVKYRASQARMRAKLEPTGSCDECGVPLAKADIKCSGDELLCGTCWAVKNSLIENIKWMR